MTDVAEARDSPRDDAVENGEVTAPPSRVSLTKNGGTHIELQRKGRQSTKLALGELDGDLADLLTELDMDGDGQINAAELTRAMQIIKNEREGVQMWKKFVVIMGTVLAVSLMINICITLYGIWYVVVTNKDTKVKNGYLMTKDSEEVDDSEDSRRRLADKYRDVAQSTEEYDEMKRNRRNSVRVQPRGRPVANYGVEDMFPFCKRGTRCEVDRDAMSVYAMNMKRLNVNTFGSGNARRSSEVKNIDSVWIFEATHEATGAELVVQCLFEQNGANVFYKMIEANGDPEGIQGGPIFFKKGTRDTLAEEQIIHMIFQDHAILMNPASFTTITQPTSSSIMGPMLANPNNNYYGIQNDWYAAEAFMYGPNRCTVTSDAFRSVCQSNGALPAPLVRQDVTTVMSREEKFERMVEQEQTTREERSMAPNRGVSRDTSNL